MTEHLNEEMMGLSTETRNLRYREIDLMSTHQVLAAINDEDKKIAFAVERALPQIGVAVDAANERFGRGGRIIYLGSGTSGRIAETDASEIRPTFDIEADRFMALQSGLILEVDDGSSEDSQEGAIRTLKNLHLNEKDVLFGIAASGRTPFVIGALRYANSVGALTISLSNNSKSLLAPHSAIAISCEVGPEVIYGSTRMKSGTSQKMILNLFSTTLMIKQGRTFGNLMSHMRVTNEKLKDRALRIVMEATNCEVEEAQKALCQTENKIPVAILHILSSASIDSCWREFHSADECIRIALKNLGG